MNERKLIELLKQVVDFIIDEIPSTQTREIAHADIISKIMKALAENESNG